MLLGPGTLIAGRYLVERKIGEGSWGEVWAGRHASVGMKVALKVLLDAKATTRDAEERFKREAKLLGRIQSDFVARVLDFLDDDIYGLVLVMELVLGESLAELLRSGPLTVERALEIGHDLVAGISDLHDARVVHRDLKPGNVILRPLPDGRKRAVIIDFSMGRLLARAGDAESSITQLTAPAMALGTLPYMAPEQILDARKAGEASDIYAVGAILYRSITGRYVFDGDDAAVARKKVSAEAPPLATGRTDATAQGFEHVVGRALRRRPEDRYPDAKTMLLELGALRDVARARAIDPHVLDHEAPAKAPSGEPADSREKTDQAAAPVSAVDAARHVRPRPNVALMTLAAACLVGVGVAAGTFLPRTPREPAATAATSMPVAVTSSTPQASSTTPAAAPIAEQTEADASVEEEIATDASTVVVDAAPLQAMHAPPAPTWRAPVVAPPSAPAPPSASAPALPTASATPPPKPSAVDVTTTATGKPAPVPTIAPPLPPTTGAPAPTRPPPSPYE